MKIFHFGAKIVKIPFFGNKKSIDLRLFSNRRSLNFPAKNPNQIYMYNFALIN